MSSSPGHSSLSPVQPGERLAGRYVVERVVGTGGMGVVVAARHEQLGRTVAIKILTISTELHPEAVERFLREARARHPCAANISPGSWMSAPTNAGATSS